MRQSTNSRFNSTSLRKKKADPFPASWDRDDTFGKLPGSIQSQETPA
jgi:hypothetical protein